MKKVDIDIKALAEQVQSQFQGLAGRHPGMWPLVPRLACALGVVVGVVALGYFGYWSGQFEEQEQGAQVELKLKEEYKTKLAQAINLDALRKQKLLVDQYVERLEKQLPSKAEMAALLSDINQAGVGRGLSFEYFKPGGVVVKDYYAELPIDLKVSGSYHDIAAFASDMANLPRIVTLNNMNVNATTSGSLSLEAVAKTFRYLDPEEVAAAKKAAAEKNKKAGAASAPPAAGAKK
ncbi:type 4a pilus biogenesis protein PilO [Massilia sp. TS11]|uniref:type 4a pilus biogenesis protein PilO n=1 Tax=Massilia sp. TS11 TaxID=2908003 RepID=UPI001EDA2EA3|nr:type 4a pilus biogenesis protein PilO [Massilia sp. TS11]MCG2584910.1 type 4a pilus biogenesis protein PilO [Massilia sp. TS11]